MIKSLHFTTKYEKWLSTRTSIFLVSDIFQKDWLNLLVNILKCLKLVASSNNTGQKILEHFINCLLGRLFLCFPSTRCVSCFWFLFSRWLTIYGIVLYLMRRINVLLDRYSKFLLAKLLFTSSRKWLKKYAYDLSIPGPTAIFEITLQLQRYWSISECKKYLTDSMIFEIWFPCWEKSGKINLNWMIKLEKNLKMV